MKKAIAIISVIAAICACVGVGILFHSSYDPAEKTAKKFAEALFAGDIKTAYKCSEDSLTVPYENFAATLAVLTTLGELDQADQDKISVLTSNAVYEEAEASEDGNSGEPTEASVAVTVVEEGESSLQLDLDLTRIDGKWYVSDFLF